MKNKLDKEYLLKIYRTYEVDNMLYALTILKSLGLNDWFKNIDDCYLIQEIKFLEKNIEFIKMFDLNKFDDYDIRSFIIGIDNGISYFNQKQLDKLYECSIKYIIEHKSELEKYLINCKYYEK